MKRLYDWEIDAEAILFLPGVIPGLAMGCKAVGTAGHNVVVQPPVYAPFFNVAKGQQLDLNFAPLTLNDNGDFLHYEIDFDVLTQAYNEDTDLFILCNPHNPVGRVWTRDELTQMAQIALDNDAIIVSDEIHCDLLFDDYKHIPIASLSPEIEKQTITLMAPSKTFNMPGLGAAFAIVPDKDLREKFQAALWTIGAHAFTMGLVGTKAAYEHGDTWLKEALAYMQMNRDYVVDYLKRELPSIKTTCPEGTYLMWLDCNAYDFGDKKPADYLAENARVALNDGAWFGEGGQGFLRLNLACPRSVLEQALNRIRDTLKTV